MKAFNIKRSLYLLPTFFFVLSFSPNISGKRIGMVLILVYLFLIPGANYLASRIRKSSLTNNSKTFTVLDIVATAFIFAGLYIGWGISWQFCLLQSLYAMISAFIDSDKKMNPNLACYLLMVVLSMVFYSLIYVGLNQYSFNILISESNIVPAILVGLIIIPTFYLDRIRAIAVGDNKIRKNLDRMLVFLIFQTIIFVIYYIVSAEHKFAAYFILLMAIPFITIYRAKLGMAKNKDIIIIPSLNLVLWLLPVGQTLFFLYYFLDTTQVLQAIKGGY